MSQATLSSDPYLNSNLFSGFYLDDKVRTLEEWDCDDEAEAAMAELQSLWEAERSLVGSYKEDPLIDAWIEKVLDVLGFGMTPEASLPSAHGYVDRLLYDSEETRREAAEAYIRADEDNRELFLRGSALLEAKQWDDDFSRKFNEDRPYRNASHQIKHYLEKTPSAIEWGILTNGRKWRLYGTRDYETETFYEIDLPELLESGSLESFKYFRYFPNESREYCLNATKQSLSV